ncbi:MBL fold metallo-hydrolase [Aurantimonas aggregata]|uniref:MBL fold metallo-hydrolase n=1 Tax=Aurantimonas aggregata TaxID=2047720 RepID=A0A6L9MLB6_9HYPH|nr:MBL fold metallo-hydrolase [Aurantimonas aggregata]NDV88571.1 MBL fold metallo-hydrolase [Aurantimonas aggregata]
MLTRRRFTIGAAALAGSLGLGSRFGASAASDALTTLSDGHLEMPTDFVLRGISAEVLQEIGVDRGALGTTLASPCILTLHRSGDRLVLFDAGAGTNFMPSAGKLPESLDAAGIDPAAVTDVIFTHAHPDHIWGVLDDFDEVPFANAAFHVCQTEWDYWRSDAALSEMPEDRQVFVIGARSRFDAIEERSTLFKPGTEVISGIEAVAAFGHTPGHCAFVLHGADAPVMVVGDAIINDPISFARPDLAWAADQDPETAARTRTALLDRLASEKLRFVGFHLPNGGLGRVETAGAGFRFVPESA